METSPVQSEEQEQSNPDQEQGVVYGHEYSQNEDGTTNQESTVSAPAEPASAEAAPTTTTTEVPVIYGHEYSQNEDGTTNQESTVSAPSEPATEAITEQPADNSREQLPDTGADIVPLAGIGLGLAAAGAIAKRAVQNRRQNR